MRLIEKIILLLLGLALIPMILVGGLMYLYANNHIEQETEANLNSIATIQQHRIASIRAQNLERLTNFTGRPALKTTLGQYDLTPTPAGRAQLLANIAQAKTADSNLSNITVITNAGIVAASTDTKLTDSNLSTTGLFKMGMQQNSMQLVGRGAGKNPVINLAGPLLINGRLTGVAEIEVSATDLLNTIHDYTGLGKSGETTLVQILPDGQTTFLTSLRFDSQAAFIRTTSNPGSAESKALAGQETTLTDTKDYRGVSVLAATRYIKDNGWGLVVKIDRAEAFQPATQLRSEFLLLAFISSVLIVFAAMALAQRAAQPILEIDEVAEEVSRGSLQDRVQDITSDEVGNLAATFNIMLDNLEVLDKAKSDFVSLASHQLRTPLTSIKWYSESLLDPGSGLTKTKRKLYLEQLHASNERMIELVNALLLVSKIDVGKLPAKAEPIQLKDALEQVINDLSVRIREKNIVVTQRVDEKLPAIVIDRTWIRLILQNLLSNAVKYSKPRQHVDIVMKGLPGHVLIKVKDSGFGIPAAQQKHIFMKFFRADNAQKEGGDGSGLGMYITKSMVERAGGSIRFESSEHRGTTFFVTLPTKNRAPNKRTIRKTAKKP